MQKEIENLNNFRDEIREKKLFLAVVRDYAFPQLVIANKYPLNEGNEAYGFFVFPFVILRSDDGEKHYTPQGIQKLKIFPFVRDINGICDSMMMKRIKFLEENIDKLTKIE